MKKIIGFLSAFILVVILFAALPSSSFACVGPGAACVNPGDCCTDTTSGCQSLGGGGSTGQKICMAKTQQNPTLPPSSSGSSACFIKDTITACQKPEDCCTPETGGQCITLGGGGFSGQKVCSVGASAKKDCKVKNTTDTCTGDGDCCLEGTDGHCSLSTHKCGAPPSPTPGGQKCFVAGGGGFTGVTVCITPGTLSPAPTLPAPPPPPCAVPLDADGKCNSFNTALGDLSTAPGMFVTRVFAVLLSVAGGIALLLIIKAGYQLMTSSGKPEAMQAGREQLVAAIVGLLFLIFSFIILEVIGIDVLKLPEFSGTGSSARTSGAQINK